MLSRFLANSTCFFKKAGWKLNRIYAKVCRMSELEQMIGVKEAAGWDTTALHGRLGAIYKILSGQGGEGLPVKRVRYQVENDSICRELIDQWPKDEGEERIEVWKKLLDGCENAVKEILPMCIRCGDCCRKGSPTLVLDDLELLSDENIRWDQLVTLREGEPAFSPFTAEPFYLAEEWIKIREKDGTSECVFFIDDGDECSIHQDRPTQCRAQGCWDGELARRQAEDPHLTRRNIFDGIKPLLTLIDEHDKRCSFLKLRELFEELKQTEGKSVDNVLEFLAYDDHLRAFAVENLNVPHGAIDLLFGRALSERVGLFGFLVETGEDGVKTLKPAE
jgi:Fe-S-cluster containining protein